jgi:hypothetical protein
MGGTLARMDVTRNAKKNLYSENLRGIEHLEETIVDGDNSKTGLIMSMFGPD